MFSFRFTASRFVGPRGLVNQHLRRAITNHQTHYFQNLTNRSIHITPTLANVDGVKISALLQKHLGLSRRQSERMILAERITLYGKLVTNPTFEVRSPDRGDVAIKVDGKLVHDVGSTLQLLEKELKDDASDEILGATFRQSKDLSMNKTRVWLCNKLKGELITEDDPDGRPSMLQRLIRGGVGVDRKNSHLPTHLKPVGRLGE